MKQRVQTSPFPGQQPGTSGLRKATPVFEQPRYLENFVQAIFDSAPELSGGTLVLGGDGRFFSERAVQTILAMAVANGVGRVIVGRGGLLSTPAASNLIRKRGAQGGIILSASHNPGGPDGDFGVKFNIANGGPAPATVTDAIYARTQQIDSYWIEAPFQLDVTRLGATRIEGCTIEVIDPVADYLALMEGLFDFDAIGRLFASGFRMRFDAMHAVTGPYGRVLFEERLGAPSGTVMNAVPKPDFGGLHPDPNPVYAAELIAVMRATEGPDFGAASDGDGDRNLIVGKGGLLVAPSDSLAVLAANAHLAPGYADGLKGVARSMPTSRALDRVAAARGLPFYETPTGWKFFSNLLEAGRITLCGEESAGTGSDHIREKDGLWAILLWLNVVAARGEGVDAILRAHWREFGRDYYARHDYERLDATVAGEIMSGLRAALPALPGRRIEAAGVSLTVSAADEFTYPDPVDGSVARQQGIRIAFEEGGRAVFRLSGTGTSGATLRVYLERFEGDPERQDLDPAAVLAPVAEAADIIAGLRRATGRTAPDVVA